MSAVNWDQLGSTAVVAGVMLSYALLKRQGRNSADLQRILNDFETLDGATLKGIVASLQDEMNSGLKKDKELIKEEGLHALKNKARMQDSLAMIPSFVTRYPTGNETGTYIALDLGGSTIRTRRVRLEKGKVAENTAVETDILIPAKIRSQEGQGDELFDFLATRAKAALPAGTDQANVGFTFSFPIAQKSITNGVLLSWTKEIATAGVVGNDVVQLLQQALARVGAPGIQVAAICNDTVGTLVATMYQVPDQAKKVVGGLIVGTGSNMAYWEKSKDIVKLPEAAEYCSQMIINMEWGNFDEREKVLPINGYDEAMNEASERKGYQLFEKMISGQYIGELCRLALIDYLRSTWNWGEVSFDRIYSVSGESASIAAHDDTAELTKIEDLFRSKFQSRTTLDMRKGIKQICYTVFKRAARLLAAGVAAIASKTNMQKDCIIGVVGSVWEKNPCVQKECMAALDDIFEQGHGIRLIITPDGSVIGPALIAALHGDH